MGGAIFCTTQQLHYRNTNDIVVLSSENASDNKSIVHTLSLKEGFCGVYIRKGARSFGGITERKKQQSMYKDNCRACSIDK